MVPPAAAGQGEKIAIIGMGCRLPGGADSPGELWRLLAEGRDAIGQWPAGRKELWDDAERESGAAQRYGGFLADVTGFDAEFFGVPEREADVLDPQHRLLLEVAWEALDHAGRPPDRLAGTATGVFAGLSYADYREILGRQPGQLTGSVMTNGSCVAGGRLSYLLGLTGPCLVLDTACSSSLVAVHLACQALRAGECDTALAGGVSLILSPRTTRSFEQMGMLSRSGRCRTFDAAADGFVRGEGCGMVVLRRLADATRDGDRILAVLRGSAVNHDGRSDGLAAPSPRAQRALLRLALERSGTDPRDVAMIETHGTGTPVGDPVEFGSLAEVYGAGSTPCAVTALKTNLGHLEPAAGISGLIKAVLCVRRGQVPPNLHFRRWNPELGAERTRFFVPTKMTGWPGPGRPRIAAVSAFGFSGTNAHVLVEEAPSQHRPKPEGVTAGAAGPMVFTVPAGSRDALPVAARRLADWLAAEGAAVPLADVGYTLARRRSAGRGRLGVVASDPGELARRLRAFAAGQADPCVVSGEVAGGVVRQPVWVFSGQGSQWPGMGATLLASDAAFAAALAEVSELMTAEAGLSVLAMVRSGSPVSGCDRVQPVLFAMQYALAAMWRAHGVRPAGVIGHSMGEVAAAVVAGALSLGDGVRVIMRRSALLSRIAGAGAMASVELDPAGTQAELARAGVAGSVSLAVLAGPASTVVAGRAAEVARLVAGWESRGIPARLIAVDVASHCAQVDPLLGELADALACLRPRTPAIPFYSTVTTPGQLPAFDAAYWCDNLRRPVKLSAAIAAAAADRRGVYIEVSPHPVVTRALTDSLAGLIADPVVLPTLRRDQDETASFRVALAAAHCAGVWVDWARLYPGGLLADVPPISFARRRHWVDGPGQEPAPGPAVRPGRLPGEHAVDRWFLEPAWSQAAVPRGHQAPPPGTWLICADLAADGQLLATALRDRGATVQVESLPPGGDALGDLAAELSGRWAGRPAPDAVVLLPPAEAASPDPGVALTRARRLLGVAQAAIGSWDSSPRLYAITAGASDVVSGERVSLGDGALRGVIRVLACEQPRLRATQIDIAAAAAAAPVLNGPRPVALHLADTAVRALAAELLGGQHEDEVALRDGTRYVARLEQAPLTARERATPASRMVRYGRDGFRLRVGRLGELRSLELATVPRRSPGPGEAELRVQAAGMNFHDVLTARGLLDRGDDAGAEVGFECAGVVTATGPGVTHIRPGDRALALNPGGGSFGSFVTMSAASVTAIPDHLTTVAAAGISAAFPTAWYALRHVARVQPGEQVLIHSATGGTGQAAVAVAGLLGADVLATAGSGAKRQILRNQGIKHVMDSRSLDFVAQVREATGGAGADVVLNSLAGPAIRAGLEALRPFGRFVELGVRDILADAPLGMLPLKHNITLSTVNLIELRLARPDFFATLLDEVMALFAAGQLSPLPGPVFPLEDAVDAFTLMASAGHVGKIVLTVPDDGPARAVIAGGNPARGDGAYIITGGLTGVGLATARWLALGGAGQVILNGRRGPSPAAGQVLAEMRAAGCQVTVVTGDIAEQATSERLVEAVSGHGVRLRGVVHSAMVLDDAGIPGITESQLRRVWTPKVTGAWQLHQATASLEPDWFVVYSSMASLLGHPGQGAYAAANSWLDAFATWRSRQGRPTLAVNWGPWGQTGAATDFATRGYQTIATDDGLRALGTLLAHRRSRTGVLPGPPDSWIPVAARTSALLRGLANGSVTNGGMAAGAAAAGAPAAGAASGVPADGAASGVAAGGAAAGGEVGGAASGDVRANLAALAPGLARRNALESYLAGQIRAVLGLGQRILDPDTVLRSLGFDSLLSIELSCQLEAGLAIKLDPRFVWAHPTLAELTDAIAERLDADLAGDDQS